MRFYRRLTDVPGVNYVGSARVQRSRLPGHDLKPTISRSQVAGKQHESAMWAYRDGNSSSASPARNWDSQSPAENAHPDEVLQHLYEVLELPGNASDYHFAIQGCFERLWSLRRTHPSVLEEIEKLCWLDIHLLEALPDTLRYEQTDGSFFYARSIAFERLIHIYERNGYIVEALDVAQRATRFHADDAILKPLQERLARLEAENES
jgi:hypothetical protein